jgi:hypothetical protein
MGDGRLCSSLGSYSVSRVLSVPMAASKVGPLKSKEDQIEVLDTSYLYVPSYGVVG